MEAFGAPGQKAMAVRFQAPPQPGRPLMETHLRQLSLPPALHSMSSLQQNLGALNSLSLPQYSLPGLKGRPPSANIPRQLSLLGMQGGQSMSGLLPRRQPEVQGFSPAGRNLPASPHASLQCYTVMRCCMVFVASFSLSWRLRSFGVKQLIN